MKTWQAFVVCIAVLTAGFVFAAYNIDAPYLAYSGAVGVVFGVYTGKRLMQKKEEFVETVD